MRIHKAQNLLSNYLMKTGFFILMVMTLLSCSQTRRSSSLQKPNVIYILADQWRAQASGYNGDPNLKDLTPNLDRMAETGVNFANAVSVCPVCTPYRAALLTGRFPTSTGMFLNDIQLPAEEYTMAEIFKDAGYQTAYIGKWHLDGMGREEFTPPERRQGFEYWKGLECSHDYNNLPYYSGDSDEKHYWEGYAPYQETVDAISYIRNNADGDKPFLLFLAWGAPHFPHNTAPEELKKIFIDRGIKLPPNVPEGQEESAISESIGYYAHILALDKCIGDLQSAVNETGIEENTILVFTSDHGEMMGSQGVRPRLKQVPYGESARVPFLLKYPAMFGSEQFSVEAPINTTDILPTLLDLAGISVPESVEGESMADAVLKPGLFAEKAALIMNISPFDIQKNEEYRGIYTSRYTYIKSLQGPWLLYDNESDPFQMNNLVSDPAQKDLLDKLDVKLLEELKKAGDDFHPRKFYIEKWAYKLNKWGNIDYSEGAEFQGPAINRRVQ